MARRASVHRTPLLWQALIHQQALRKQSVKRFCQENGLTVSSFIFGVRNWEGNKRERVVLHI